MEHWESTRSNVPGLFTSVAAVGISHNKPSGLVDARQHDKMAGRGKVAGTDARDNGHTGSKGLGHTPRISGHLLTYHAQLSSADRHELPQCHAVHGEPGILAQSSHFHGTPIRTPR